MLGFLIASLHEHKHCKKVFLFFGEEKKWNHFENVFLNVFKFSERTLPRNESARSLDIKNSVLIDSSYCRQNNSSSKKSMS